MDIDQALTFFIYLFIAFALISIAGTQISLGVVLVLWIGRMVRERKWLVVATPLDSAFLLLIIAFVLATVFSLQPWASFKNLKNPLLFIIVYALAANVHRENALKRCLAIFFVTATLVSGISLVSTQIMAGKKVMGLQSTTMTWGAMSVIFSTLTVSQILFGQASRKRWLYAAALAVQLAAMLFSYVRGAWIGFMAAVVFLLIVKNKKMILLLAALAAVIVAVAPAQLQQRMLNITNLNVGSTQVRLTQWQHSLEIFKDHPITGVGWIDLAQVHKTYAPADADLTSQVYTIGHFHSNYVMFLVCFGLVGVCGLLFFLFKLFTTLWRTWRAVAGTLAPILSAWVIGCLAASLGFWINGFFDWTFGDAEPVSLLWVVIGLAFAVDRQLKHVKEVL